MAQTRSGTKSVNEPNQKSRGSLSESLLQRNQRNQRSTTPRETRATSIGGGENFFQVCILKHLILMMLNMPYQKIFSLFMSLWIVYIESDCQLKQAQLIRLSAHGM